MTTDSKIQKISALYDSGASLATIISEVGADDESLRLIHSRLGVAMSTLRRVAESPPEQRAKSRALLILGMNALADALWKNEQITDDEIGAQALRAGAQSVREIVREVVE